MRLGCNKCKSSNRREIYTEIPIISCFSLSFLHDGVSICFVYAEIKPLAPIPTNVTCKFGISIMRVGRLSCSKQGSGTRLLIFNRASCLCWMRVCFVFSPVEFRAHRQQIQKNRSVRDQRSKLYLNRLNYFANFRMCQLKEGERRKERVSESRSSTRSSAARS